MSFSDPVKIIDHIPQDIDMKIDSLNHIGLSDAVIGTIFFNQFKTLLFVFFDDLCKRGCGLLLIVQ